jgi:hypothetical protein
VYWMGKTNSISVHAAMSPAAEIVTAICFRLITSSSRIQSQADPFGGMRSAGCV